MGTDGLINRERSGLQNMPAPFVRLVAEQDQERKSQVLSVRRNRIFHLVAKHRDFDELAIDGGKT